MKHYQVNDGQGILDKISYANLPELKSLLKFILTTNVTAGDSAVMCVLADLKTVLGFYDSSKDLKVLTSKQRKVIVEHLMNDKTQSDLAKELNITQQGVSILLGSALKRIRNYLKDGELNWMPWSLEEKEYLMKSYGKVPIYKLSKELNKPQSRVISMYHFLKNLEARGGK